MLPHVKCRELLRVCGSSWRTMKTSFLRLIHGEHDVTQRLIWANVQAMLGIKSEVHYLRSQQPRLEEAGHRPDHHQAPPLPGRYKNAERLNN